MTEIGDRIQVGTAAPNTELYRQSVCWTIKEFVEGRIPGRCPISAVWIPTRIGYFKATLTLTTKTSSPPLRRLRFRACTLYSSCLHLWR
jgi:hypothetical protein